MAAAQHTRRCCSSALQVVTIKATASVRPNSRRSCAALYPPRGHRLASSATSSSSASSSSSAVPQQQQQQQQQQRAAAAAATAYYYKQSHCGNSQTQQSSSAKTNFDLHNRNVQVAWYAAAAVVGALGATYASVPLYKLFCQVTGFGGTTQRVELTTNNNNDSDSSSRAASTLSKMLQTIASTATGSTTTTTTTATGKGTRVHTWTDEEAAQRLASLKPVENGRLLTITMDSTVGDVLPWTFEPIQRFLKVVPGETALTFFRVSNLSSDKAITGVATYNVHPPKAGLYFSKIQCFCFEEQRLLPGETVDMPVFFFVDPEFLDDAQLANVHNITLSYTFFQTDVEDEDYDDDDNEENEVEEQRQAAA